jgi:hypothetical protein
MLEKFSSLGIQASEIGAGGYTLGEADAVIGVVRHRVPTLHESRGQYRGIRDSSSLYLIWHYDPEMLNMDLS